MNLAFDPALRTSKTGTILITDVINFVTTRLKISNPDILMKNYGFLKLLFVMELGLLSLPLHSNILIEAPL